MAGCLLILGSCRHKDTTLNIANHSEISIKTANQHYVCADRNQNNQIIADRKEIGEWEKFTIQILKNDEFRLRTSDYSYVGVNHNKEGTLSAGFPATENSTVFKLIQHISGGYSIQDFNKRYVIVDNDNNLKADKVQLDNANIFFLDEVMIKKASNFSMDQLIPLILGLILMVMSLLAFHNNEASKLSVLLLLLGGFCVRLFIMLLNGHLNMWDEQFHALVAKNMIENPFTPMLYKEPVLPFDDKSWVGGNIWLHKQPLFLWQMALSMKVFGINVIALRLPSLLMSTVIMYFMFRIGKILINSSVGFFGSLLFAISNFTLEMTAGTIHTDHNDVAFLFYITASIWAWVEYENTNPSNKKYYILLIGLFSGSAILVKWLTGLLVFSGWAVSILVIKERRVQWVHYRNLILSLSITIVVFLPWQLYILHTFPILSQFEFNLNTRHFIDVIEGHGGNFWWHFDKAQEIYGVGKYFLLFCVIIFYQSIKNKVLRYATIVYIILIYLFFGLAATKMIGFTYCISSFVYLSMGNLIEKYFKVVVLNPIYFPKRIHYLIYSTLILIIISGFNLNFDKIRANHTMWKQDTNSFFYKRMSTTPVINSLTARNENLINGVLFNCRPDDNIPIMFFNDIRAAYSHIPDYDTYVHLKQKGYKQAVFDDGSLPSYLLVDKEVLKIPKYWSP